MQNFLAIRPDPLQLPLPNGLSEDQQSSKPILQFCWMVRMEGGNKVWRCKLCNKEFTGSNVVVATHFWSKMSSQSCRKCSAQLPPVLIEQLEIAWMNKKQADEALAKRACTMDSLTTVLNRPQSVSAQLSALARPHADAAI